MILPVTLASADAYARNPPDAGCLPHSFSTMVCLSLEAIDITAALARCAMSRTVEPEDGFAALSSAILASASFGAVAGTFKASLVAGAATFGLGVSAGFDA